MTDITELAQSLKAAAEKATPGQWMRSSVQFNSITDIANPMEQGNKPHIANTSEKRDAEFIAMANPDNVLALVEALEKAQAKATQQGNIACVLLDEVTQLRRHADEKAPELRAQLIEADSELEALRQRIAELESSTVTVKLPDLRQIVSGDRYVWSDGVFNYSQDVKAALTAAGIKWEAE
ncbi:ead/Ea22-like family protein [Raoultella planticola]|uniref:ead/Ea22-like family protein n=1 Tax=Raoultella planticola TaxID=575 RepID=UPI0010ADAC71|nr:ead/Ea22-like family protein [Raoultella planticola]TJZ66186.1 ead/Ea22-like family protein [Raoultella planticola]